MLKKPIILPEGYPFIIVALLLGVIGLWMKWYYAAVVPFVLAVYFTYFFRCPPRNDKITPGDDVLVSPADGTVVDVCHDAKEDMFLGQTCHKITIFLSIFDVHCNRSPMEGKITYQPIRRANSCLRMRKGWALKMNAAPSGSRARTDPSWSSSSRGYWHDASFPGKIWETA